MMMRQAILLSGSLLFATELNAQEVDSSAWQLDFEKAKATARQTGKPIFLVIR